MPLKRSEKRANLSSQALWLIRRFARVFVVWMLACLALFLLIECLPGDAATVLVGKGGEEAVASARNEMGLDRPWHVRYLEWLRELFHGDLGHCLTTEQKVVSVVAKPLLASLTVFAIVMLGLLTVTLPLALVSSYRRGKTAAFLSGFSVALSAVPEFVTAIVLVGGLALGLRIVPVLSVPGPGKTVWSRPITLVLPALCMWIVCSAAIYRRLCAMVQTYAGTAYIRDAELAGLSSFRILTAHLLPTIRSAIGQLLAQCVPYLLGGAIVIEYVTSFPGMGLTLTMAIDKRETPIIMSICALLIAVSTVFYTVADVLMKKNERVSEVI